MSTNCCFRCDALCEAPVHSGWHLFANANDVSKLLCLWFERSSTCDVSKCNWAFSSLGLHSPVCLICLPTAILRVIPQAMLHTIHVRTWMQRDTRADDILHFMTLSSSFWCRCNLIFLYCNMTHHTSWWVGHTKQYQLAACIKDLCKATHLQQGYKEADLTIFRAHGWHEQLPNFGLRRTNTSRKEDWQQGWTQPMPQACLE